MLVGDTIAALATPFGAGAVALVRLSGPEALAVADRVFHGPRPLAECPPGRVLRGTIVLGGQTLDEVLCTVFRAPRSYTGEDVVEISGHGGPVVVRSVLRALFEAGARPAEAGEFTRRAFLNGKMDLTRAEAVIDLINARGEAAARAAIAQLEGRLGKAIEKLRDGLLQAVAHLEAYIDFPEEGIDAEGGKQLLGRVEQLRQSVERLLSTADEGRMLREGVRLVIFGAPNAGKSSLLNLLLGYDRAMVSEVPGTTRDTIEENLTLRGIPFRVIDTAGLRASDDPLEQEGIRRTRLRLDEADVAVRVIEASDLPCVEDPGTREVRVLNKIDLWSSGPFPAGFVPVCTLDGRGLEELVDAIAACAELGSDGRLEDAVAINARHQHCLRAASDFLCSATESLERGDAPELTAVELRSALAAVGEIVGAVDTEEILGEIFGRFCIGK